ncbi:hypothetical protein BGW36DRAFT_405100 [Talaromyces proteolyticus]|uniref:Uncharacterized protein n=1 Tax=Talaromyces proteolyticus TaxID=1131652 RepID=A0AAD4Q437_9EURO|nr:uncharacterized protein BGW36DRAFT_405100 [Talaromyces proteolyticus]KAH8702292.1 hypothetical protein BGW36DRAFT_405100 [Talaromyces proteolyticus]
MPPNKPKQPIKAFNNTLDMVDAYTWNIDAIYDWIGEVADDPAKFGAPEKGDDLEAKKAHLEKIKKQIIKLGVPAPRWKGGEEYQDAQLTPNQHIRRRLNTNNVPPPPEYTYIEPPIEKSPFEVNGSESQKKNGNGAAVLFPSMLFWNPCDLMGLFLSTIGLAPAAANKEQFYVPLLAMFGLWCAKISPPVWKDGNSRNHGNYFPAVVQCTWGKAQGVPGARDDFFLGASYSGISLAGPWSPTQYFWDRVVRYERFKLVPIQSLKFDDSPARGNGSGTADVPGHRFGNCAETYPFTNMMRDPSHNLQGIAINSRYTSYPAPEKKIKDNIVDPCFNCQDWILRCRGTVNNFAKAGTVKKLWVPPPAMF